MCFNYYSHSDIKPWVFLSCSLCLSSVSLLFFSVFLSLTVLTPDIPIKTEDALANEPG